ncbi:inosine-uridine nucleoside N-ribohydrolase [Leifsonia sp. 563]|uniref:nucleoside hydrolase n=1 Tax=Leifsonia sp. 563 TaxID=3156412 RepID=UPI003398F8BA
MHRLIIETDLFSDVDDVGALAIAHALADDGRCEILTVGVNTPSIYGVPAARGVNGFFGRPGIPVGRFPLQDESVSEPDYARFITENYVVPRAQDAELAVTVHRRALAEAAAASVTVVSIGFFGNLRDLIESPPDDISDLDGRSLVAGAVTRLIVMGGRFPEGHEFNIAHDPVAAAFVLSRWPTPVEFVGWETGFEVVTGRGLSRDSEHNLVGAAYRRFSGEGSGRASWDLIAMHYAVVSDPDLYVLSPRGRLTVGQNGWTRFVTDDLGPHRHISLAAEPARVGDALDALLERSTRARRLPTRRPA